MSFLQQVAEFGDLQLQMSYLQSAERLTVVVLKARNLKPLEESKHASKSSYFILQQ